MHQNYPLSCDKKPGLSTIMSKLYLSSTTGL